MFRWVCALKIFFLLMPSWCLAFRAPGKEKLQEDLDDQSDGAHLCDAAIVRQECLLLSGDPSITSSNDLKQVMASAEVSVSAFWNAVLPDSPPKNPVTCQKLCLATVAFVSKHMTLPPAIDTGCYVAGNQVVCDLDLSGTALEGRLHMRRKNVPDMQEPKPTFQRQIKEFNAIKKQLADGGRPTAHHMQGIEYGVWEAAVRVANLFRIYPLPSFSFGSFGEAPPMPPTMDDGINGSSFIEQGSLGMCSPVTCRSKPDCSRFPYSCSGCGMCASHPNTQPVSSTAICFDESVCASRCSSFPTECGGCRACQPKASCASFCLNAGYCGPYPQKCGGCGFCQRRSPITTETTTSTTTVSSRGLCEPVCQQQYDPAVGWNIQPETLCSEYVAVCGGCQFCPPMNSCDKRCAGMASTVGVETVCPAYPAECGSCEFCTSFAAKPLDWRVELQKRSQEAQAYINTAIRQFRRKATREQITKWFGSDAFTNQDSRNEVVRTLNSVDRMLGNVHYVYPGKNCGFGVYAYVYPKGGPEDGDEDTMTSDGKYIFYLCPLYVYSEPSVQVETLTHEGSHHATAYTDDVCMDEFYGEDTEPPELQALDLNNVPEDVKIGDILALHGEQGEEILIVVRFIRNGQVLIQMDPPLSDCTQKAYGREPCQTLAKGLPWKALRNADNFCYYVQDVTDAA